MIGSAVTLCLGISFLPPESLNIYSMSVSLHMVECTIKKVGRYKIIFIYFVKVFVFCVNIVICLADFYHHSSREFCTFQNEACIRIFILNYELLSTQKKCLDTLENSHGGRIFGQSQGC